MKKRNRWIESRRGQVLVVSIIIAVTIALTTSYILLRYMFKNQNPQQQLGSYQSGIIDALSDGDKLLLYVDQSSKMSVNDAWNEYNYGNPKPQESDGLYSLQNYCGSYVYRLWNSANKDCFPNYTSSDFEMNILINKNLAKMTYLSQSSGSDDMIYLDKLLENKIAYRYYYYPNENYTNIAGLAQDEYPIYIFMNSKLRSEDRLLDYIDEKTQLGSQGDITGVPFSSAASGNYRASNSREIEYIVIHYTAGYSIKDAMSRFTTPGEDASAHYIIGRKNDDFKVVQAVRDMDIAYHAGCDSEKYGCSKEEYKKINSRSIGIEIVNSGFLCDTSGSCTGTDRACFGPYLVGGVQRSDAKCWQSYPDEQYEKAVALSALLAKKYSIPVDREHIIGHVEVVQQKKVDPGPAFDMDKFVSDVLAQMSKDDSELNAIIASSLEPKCTGENDDWKISSSLSSSSITSKDVLDIQLDFRNKGESCIAATPQMQFALQGISDQKIEGKSLNVYANDEITAQKISCTFTTDLAYSLEEQKKGNCVIRIKEDGNSDFDISVSAKDNDGNTHQADTMKLSVKKVADAQQIDQPKASLVVLSASEQATLSKTMTNLADLGAMPYIKKASEDYDIPEEILIGKITYESAGVNHKIGLDRMPKNRAIGITQVEGWQHYDTISQICGKDHVSECSSCGNDADSYKDCCKFETYGNDIECQINVGAKILREFYDRYNGNDDAYSKAVMNSCHDPQNQQKYLQYTGWERALRMYNGAGCSDTVSSYVEKVTRYADGAGYIPAKDAIIKEELHEGIIGTYKIKPIFNTKLNIDLRLFDLLSGFVVQTSKECGAEGKDKKMCLAESIERFNSNMPLVYKGKINLTQDCDASANIKAVNEFVEDINDCVNGQDMDCNCEIRTSDYGINSIESKDGYTELTYYSDNVEKKAYLDYEVFDEKGNPLKKSILMLNKIHIYRNNDPNKPLVFSDAPHDTCTRAKNTFRLCLKTSYTYPVYHQDAIDSEKITQENIIIPFAMMIRDDIAPTPVKDFASTSFAHSKDAIALSWAKNPENDVSRYNLYFSDELISYDVKTSFYRTNMFYRSISSSKDMYEEYSSIDLNNPVCIPTIVPADDVFCTFKYNAIDKNGNPIQLELKKEQLYYLLSENRFLYILDGSKAEYHLKTDSEKFIAITALDIDGNEIDNVEMDEKIVQGQNLIAVVPKDLLEPALVKDPNFEVSSDGNSVIAAFNAVSSFIDGQKSDEKFTYKVYLSDQSCSEIIQSKESATLLYTSSETSGELQIDSSSLESKDYCIGISVSKDTLEYDQVFFRPITIPQKMNQ